MKKTSGFEKLSRKILRFYFPNEAIEYNAHFDWLKSHKGNPMELDIYFPDKKLAFEINGLWHITVRQREADRQKEMLCAKQKIALYPVESINQLLSTLEIQFNKKTRLPKNLKKQIDWFNKQVTPFDLIRDIRRSHAVQK